MAVRRRHNLCYVSLRVEVPRPVGIGLTAGGRNPCAPVTSCDRSRATLKAIPEGSHLHELLTAPTMVYVGGQPAMFLDRDGTHFRYILNFLRDGDSAVLPVYAPQAVVELAQVRAAAMCCHVLCASLTGSRRVGCLVHARRRLLCTGCRSSWLC